MNLFAESSEALLPQKVEVQATSHAYSGNQDHLDKNPACTYSMELSQIKTKGNLRGGGVGKEHTNLMPAWCYKFAFHYTTFRTKNPI